MNKTAFVFSLLTALSTLSCTLPAEEENVDAQEEELSIVTRHIVRVDTPSMQNVLGIFYKPGAKFPSTPVVLFHDDATPSYGYTAKLPWRGAEGDGVLLLIVEPYTQWKAVNLPNSDKIHSWFFNPKPADASHRIEFTKETILVP